LNRTALFQVSFVHQNMPQAATPIGELVDEPYAGNQLTARFDLSVVSFERDKQVHFELIFNEDLFDRWQIEQLARQFVHFLREALRDPARRVEHIPVVPTEERDRLLVEWNRTPGSVPPVTVPDMFEAQVARTPDATALVLGTAGLSYRDLDTRA